MFISFMEPVRKVTDPEIMPVLLVITDNYRLGNYCGMFNHPVSFINFKMYLFERSTPP